MLFNFKLFSLLNSFTFKSHHAASSAIEISILMHLSISRYVNDGRPFWQYMAGTSTGYSDLQYLEEL